MKARTLLARCCCGKGYTGKCKTPCGSNWNGCTPSSSGSVYTSLADAYNNCGWHRTIFGSGSLTGSAGTFSSEGYNILDRYFALDYRSGGLVTFQSEVTVPARSGFDSYEPNQIRMNAPAQGGGSALAGGFVFAGEYTSTRFGTTRTRVLYADTNPLTQLNPASATQTLKMEADLDNAEILSTISGSGSYFNGSVVTANTCIESVKVPVEYYVGGSSIGSGYYQMFFQGHRCYFQVQFSLQGFSGTPVSVDNTTISVT